MRFLRIDLMVSGSSLTLAKTFPHGDESRQFSIIPDVGLTKCSHIERKYPDTSR